jgi:hypothetical protein
MAEHVGEGAGVDLIPWRDPLSTIWFDSHPAYGEWHRMTVQRRMTALLKAFRTGRFNEC